MTLNTILSAIFIAGCYAFWPLFAKRTGVIGQWAGTVVVVATVIPVALLSAKSMIQTSITSKALLLLTLVGLLNGLAVFIYGMKATSPMVKTGAFTMTVSILFFTWTPIFEWYVNNQVITARQLTGVLMAMIAIYLLKG